MKLYTSYFYQVRNMRPNQIPVSTAKWDPRWFHDFKDSDYIFIDKRGVINGVRFPRFAPGPSCEGLCPEHYSCKVIQDGKCAFLKAYREQLSKLDFAETMAIMSGIAKEFKESGGLAEEPDFILLVHEAPDNFCSERLVIQEWFRNHNVHIEEWKP